MGKAKYVLLMLLCIICMLLGSAFTLYRKYRVYGMMFRDISGLFQIVCPMQDGT